MNAKRMFAGVTRPLHDEIFASWLTRGSLSGDRKLLDVVGTLSVNGIGDPDGNDQQQAIEISSNIIGCNTKAIRLLMPSPTLWLPPLAYRRKYCCSCLSHDIANGRYPVYRKSWIHRWAVGCPFHLHPLSVIDRSVASIDQMLRYGVDAVVSGKTNWEKFRPNDIKQAALARPDIGCFMIALHLQQWLRKFRDSQIITLPSGQPILYIHLLQILEASSITLIQPVDRGALMPSTTRGRWNVNKHPIMSIDADRDLPPYDLSRYSPLHISTLLTLLGIFLKIPSCIALWRIFGHRACYSASFHSTRFSEQHDEMKEEILNMLVNYNNPHLNLMENWLSSPGVDRLRHSPFRFM